MDLIVVLFEVGLFSLEGPRLKTGPISKPLAFVCDSRGDFFATRSRSHATFTDQYTN
jgi:hypothetical protein